MVSTADDDARAEYERALAHVVDQLKGEFGDHLLGLLLAGSYARGEIMATSDIDLYVVIDEPWRQRRNLLVDGVEVELHITPPHLVSGHFLEFESTLNMFVEGRILHDPQGVVARLVAEANSIDEQPRPIPLGDDLEWLRYGVTDDLKDTKDLLEAGDEGFDAMVTQALGTTLDAYFKLAGRKTPKRKYLMRELRAVEPALADAINAILDTRTDRAERFATLDRLAREVLEQVGGLLVTSETTRTRVDSVPVIAHIAGLELPPEDVVVVSPRRRGIVSVLVYALLGLGLFVVALGLMKAGAGALAPALRGSVFTDNALSTLGLGWLGACIVLSGSPVAASALTLFDGGSIDRSQSFTMLTGSRLGAAFVVLVAGAVYALRHRTGSGRRAPISIGILSLVMTMAIYVPGALIGYVLLDRGALDGLTIGTSPSVTSVTDAAFGWIVDLAKQAFPGWALFPIGVVVLLLGFWLIDKVMPSVSAERTEDHEAQWYQRKWSMFFLGCGVCMLTLSVSVALTLLVPLVAKGYLRRANTLPYIAGANITTLADTLVAAILIGNLDAVRVVLAATISVAVLTVIALAFFYPLLRRFCLGIAHQVLVSEVRLAGFVALLFLVPVVLIAL